MSVPPCRSYTERGFCMRGRNCSLPHHGNGGHHETTPAAVGVGDMEFLFFWVPRMDTGVWSLPPPTSDPGEGKRESERMGTQHDDSDNDDNNNHIIENNNNNNNNNNGKHNLPSLNNTENKPDDRYVPNSIGPVRSVRKKRRPNPLSSKSKVPKKRLPAKRKPPAFPIQTSQPTPDSPPTPDSNDNTIRDPSLYSRDGDNVQPSTSSSATQETHSITNDNDKNDNDHNVAGSNPIDDESDHPSVSSPNRSSSSSTTSSIQSSSNHDTTSTPGRIPPGRYTVSRSLRQKVLNKLITLIHPLANTSESDTVVSRATRAEQELYAGGILESQYKAGARDLANKLRKGSISLARLPSMNEDDDDVMAPIIPYEPNASVSRGLRQRMLDKFVDLFKAGGNNQRDAINSALTEERRIYGQGVAPAVYKNECAHTLGRLRRQKQKTPPDSVLKGESSTTSTSTKSNIDHSESQPIVPFMANSTVPRKLRQFALDKILNILKKQNSSSPNKQAIQYEQQLYGNGVTTQVYKNSLAHLITRLRK